MSHIGEYIKKVRLQKDIRQTYIGKRLGYTSQFVANWERGVSSPPVHCLKELCLILNVPRSKVKAALLKDYRVFLNKNI